MPIIATNTAAIAVIADATPRQRLARPARRTTFDVSTGAAGALGCIVGGVAAGDSGNTIGACGWAIPIALRIRCQTSSGGSTEPTIWFNTPSLYSQARTMAVKSLSTDIMVST